MEKGFPVNMTEKAKIRVDSVECRTLLLNRSMAPCNHISFALQFSHSVYLIKQTIYKHWHLLQHVPHCQQFPKTGFRWNKSIRDMLVLSGFETGSMIRNYVCGGSAIWSFVMHVKSFHDPQTDYTMKLSELSNCSFKNNLSHPMPL